MQSTYKVFLVFAATLSLAGVARAEYESTDPAAQAPVTEPVAVSTAAVTEPVAVSTAAAVAPVAAAPAQNEESTWNKLDGTVRSVDRYNRELIVKGADGKDVRVAYNKDVRIYRQGEQIGYSDVETNDRVSLRSDSDQPRHEASN